MFRASGYKNRKGEEKFQVSMTKDQRDKLVKGDKDATKELLEALKSAKLKD